MWHWISYQWFTYWWPSDKGNGPEALQQTAVYAALAVTFIPAVRKFFHDRFEAAKNLAEKHHKDKIEQAERHHEEGLAQQSDHHEALKQHISDILKK